MIEKKKPIIFYIFRYLWAGLLVVMGIYLNIYSKRNKLTMKEFIDKINNFSILPKKIRHIYERHQKDATFEV